jgi:CubicO group peptidase (beta-lactamase class C family)
MYQILTLDVRRAATAAILLFGAAASAHADKVDDYIQHQMAINHVPGVAVAVVRDGKVIKMKAYGLANLEWQQRVTPDTAFQLASSTKPFTGMLVMRLQEEGKLKLTDSVAKYLPNAPESWKPVTLRHLIDHSSGIPDHVPDAGKTVDEFVAAAQALPLVHAPGASAEYGIGGYKVLSKVIEVAAGMPYTQALKRYVTGPLGLHADFEYTTGSGDMRSFEVMPRRASVYEWTGDRYINSNFVFGQVSYDAGGLLASVDDVARVAVALDDGKFLRKESVAEMWTPARLGNGEVNGFGAGWVVRDINGRKTVGHSGGPALSDILRYPHEKMTFVVLTNGKSLYPYLAQVVSELYLPPPPVVMPKGIEDARPQVTAALRKAVLDGADGRVEEALFSEEAQKEFVPGYRSFMLPFLRSLPKLDEMVLVSEKATEEGMQRTYRARHGKKGVTWQVDFDKDGKLQGFGPK